MARTGARDRGAAGRGSGDRPVAEWTAEVTVGEELARRLIQEQFPADGDRPRRSPPSPPPGGDDGAPTAVIDWIDLCRADPGVDLSLYWCALPPDGRSEFLDGYGSLSDEQLLRGRVLALFLCGALALWGHHEGVESVKREALEGLARTCS